MGPWWDSEQPEPFQMYAQMGQQVRPQLPAGHPSNMLMWLRDQIPQVQADDTSLASGITSRLGRTATAIPRAGLETAANWLRGVNDPNAVRIGEDTIAPLGLFGMAGLAARAPRAAATAARSDAAIARDLAARYPDEIAGGSMSRQAIAGGPRMGVVSDEGMTPLTLTRDAMHGPGDFVNRAPPLGRPANLMADNAKSSLPGTVVNSVASQNYESMTLPQLKALAKERGLVNTIDNSKAGWIETLRSGRGNALDESTYASPSASLPGLAANATQEGPDEATLAILRQYGIIQ